MPHGGGHVSHHHGGGGGHFGGGGHRHHHHHHRHNHYGGVVYTGGGYYGGYRSRYRVWLWGGIGLFLTAAVVIAVTCSVTLSRKEEEENRFASGDTRIKRFENFFCSGIKASTSYGFSDKSAKAYVIKQAPSLTDRSNVSFEDGFTLYADRYNYWHFFLYKNSNISLDACINTGNGYWFYIIKGTSKWNDWKDYASDSKAVFNSFISRSCDNGMVTKRYRVTGNDHYYIAYYNSDPDVEVSGKQTLGLHRFEYSEPPDTNLPSCSFAGPNTGSSCSVKVPMLSDQTKVLVRFPNVTDDAEQDFHVNLDCIPRPEAYVIVVVPPVILVIVVCTCIVACVVYRKKAKKKQYRPLLSEGTANHTPALDPSAPPPFNPGFQNEAPPPYK